MLYIVLVGVLVHKGGLLRTMNPLVLAFRLRRRGLDLANRKSFRISPLGKPFIASAAWKWNLAFGTLAAIIRVLAPSFSDSSVYLSWGLGYCTRVSSPRESISKRTRYDIVKWNSCPYGMTAFVSSAARVKLELDERSCSANFEQLYLFITCMSWRNAQTLRAYKEHTWYVIVCCFQ